MVKHEKKKHERQGRLDKSVCACTKSDKSVHLYGNTGFAGVCLHLYGYIVQLQCKAKPTDTNHRIVNHSAMVCGVEWYVCVCVCVCVHVSDGVCVCVFTSLMVVCVFTSLMVVCVCSPV